MALPTTEFRQAENDHLRLHLLKPREVDAAEVLALEVDELFNCLAFGEHSGGDVIRFEDKHPPFSAPLHDDFLPLQ